MKKPEAAVRLLLSEIAGRDILEPACGCAEFSRAAAAYARSVMCIDLVESRIREALPERVRFEIMDAAAMRFPNESYDAVFFYNAFDHIRPQWTEIETECRRVLKPGGQIHLLATWKLDQTALLEQYGEAVHRQKGFMLVTLKK